MTSVLMRIFRKLDHLLGVDIEKTLFYELRSEWQSSAVLPPGLKVLILEPGSLQAVESVGGTTLGEARNRIARGDVCYCGVLAGVLVHCSWVQKSGSHPVTSAGLVENILPGEFWIYNCSTVKWARGRNVYPYTLSMIVADCFRQGFRTARIYTTVENVASQKGIVRAGFSLTESKRSIRFGQHYRRL